MEWNAASDGAEKNVSVRTVMAAWRMSTRYQFVPYLNDPEDFIFFDLHKYPLLTSLPHSPKRNSPPRVVCVVSCRVVCVVLCCVRHASLPSDPGKAQKMMHASVGHMRAADDFLVSLMCCSGLQSLQKPMERLLVAIHWLKMHWPGTHLTTPAHTRTRTTAHTHDRTRARTRTTAHTHDRTRTHTMNE
jgi:hypothetical protein